jgi:polyvinyl alcohol dehydrogenase (cytochrome)
MLTARSVLVVVFFGLVASSICARAQPPAGGNAGNSSPTSPSGAGAAVFQRVCAACHLSVVQTSNANPGRPMETKALPREMLRNFPPGAILNALTNGKMQAQAAALSVAERRAVAEYVSGKSLDEGKAAATEKVSLCAPEHGAMRDPASGPAWNGWGNGPANTRYQSKLQGGLTAADLPRLELKWAYAYVNVTSARTQPSVAGGRLFIGSDTGEVRALDPKTGCQYWTFKAQAGVASSPMVGRYQNAAGARGFAVYFGDRKANAYAVDASTGQAVWTRKVDDHKLAGITGSLTYFAGRVLVPVQGIGEEGNGTHNKYPCCSFRGSVSALDANTGAVIWKTYTVAESRPRGTTKEGVEAFGPAGGAIWSAPTVDAKRHLVYVGTGNGYADPPQPMTDAIVALQLNTGAVKWVRQVAPEDQWAMGCDPTNGPDTACPKKLGLDYDFSAPPAIARVNGHDVLVVPQKAAIAWALDPDKDGAILWRYAFGQGSGLGGQWGTAIEGDRAFFGVADLLTPHPGGMRAVSIATGKPVWQMPPQPKLCGETIGCIAGQGSPVTVIPGAVLSSSMDGGLRAYSTKDGSILWTFDSNREFDTVNGVKAHGGSMDGAGPVVVDGMLFANSGYGGLLGVPGNVLLAFGLKK